MDWEKKNFRTEKEGKEDGAVCRRRRGRMVSAVGRRASSVARHVAEGKRKPHGADAPWGFECEITPGVRLTLDDLGSGDHVAGRVADLHHIGAGSCIDTHVDHVAAHSRHGLRIDEVAGQ